MARAHFVLETRRVRDESGRFHVGSVESGLDCAQVRPHFAAVVAHDAGVESDRQPEV
jgi:hypothetical protein